MNFTQYLFPSGKPSPVSIEMPPEVEALASDLVGANWSFDIECDPSTGLVFADCNDGEDDLGNALVANGPEVPGAIEKMVRAAHENWIKRGRERGGQPRVGDDEDAPPQPADVPPPQPEAK